jgi:hypothetical protein
MVSSGRFAALRLDTPAGMRHERSAMLPDPTLIAQRDFSVARERLEQ